MKQSSQAIRKLDGLLMVLVGVVSIFATLSIFKFDTASFLTISNTIWVGMLFAVGGTIKVCVWSHALEPRGVCNILVRVSSIRRGRQSNH